MKLKIGLKTIQAVMQPYNTSMIDIVSINPRLQVGDFKGCIIEVIPNKTLIITNGIIMMYTNLGDFLAGLDPLAIVKDETIYYDQRLHSIDFQIVDDLGDEDVKADFAPVRELMFGARIEPEVHDEKS